MWAVTVTKTYYYQGKYLPPFSDPENTLLSFSVPSSTNDSINAIPIRALNQYALQTTATYRIGVQDAAPLGLGGWTISPHHVYDPASQTLWRGDGPRTTNTEIVPVIQSVPGPSQLTQVAAAPDGTVYVDVHTASGYGIARLHSDGSTTVVGGGNGAGPTGPFASCGIAATGVDLYFGIEGLAVSATGLVYVAEGSMIHAIDPGQAHLRARKSC